MNGATSTGGAWSVLGQDVALTRLRTLWQGGSGPHTLVLAGPDGVGRRPVARWLAAFVNCAAVDASERPCGTCATCTAIFAGEHQDVREVGPRLTTKSGRAKREAEITIDQLVLRPGGDPEPLGPWLMQRPRARKRVGIIDGAESLNLNAANAFLKMLEEPPSWAIIVLVASAPDALLPTIASRASVVRLSPVDTTAFADLAPHPALRLGQLGPLLAARHDPQPLADMRSAVNAFVSAIDLDLSTALEAASALAGRADVAGLSATALLREQLRARPARRYGQALEAIDACEDALAAYANPSLAFTVLALALRAHRPDGSLTS